MTIVRCAGCECMPSPQIPIPGRPTKSSTRTLSFSKATRYALSITLVGSCAAAPEAPSWAASPPRPASRSFRRVSFDVFMFPPRVFVVVGPLLLTLSECLGALLDLGGVDMAGGRPEEAHQLIEQAIGAGGVGFVEPLEPGQRVEHEFRIDARLQGGEALFREPALRRLAAELGGAQRGQHSGVPRSGHRDRRRQAAE